MYDFTAMAYYGMLDFAMSFHHWTCIIGMSLPLTYGLSGNYIVLGMYIAEISNPFMHVRCVLRSYGLRYTKSYELMEILFMMLYIYGRLIIGPYIVWSTVTCESNHFIVRLASVGLLV